MNSINKILDVYLGKDLTEIIDQLPNKILSPGGIKISAYFLRFDLEDRLIVSEGMDQVKLVTSINAMANMIINNVLDSAGFIQEINSGTITAYFRSNNLSGIKKAIFQIYKEEEQINQFIKNEYSIEYNILTSIHFGDAVFSVFGNEKRLHKTLIGKDWKIVNTIRDLLENQRIDLCMTSNAYDEILNNEIKNFANTETIKYNKDQLTIYTIGKEKFLTTAST